MTDGEGETTESGYYCATVNYPITFASVYAMGATNGSGYGPHFLSSSLYLDHIKLGTYVAQSNPSYLTSFGLRSHNMVRIKAIIVGI